MTNPFKNKKFKYGGLSIAVTAIFVVAIILLNFIVNLTLDRFDTKIDLTDASIYTIGEDTTKILSNLDGEVKITVLADEINFTAAGSLYAMYIGANLDYNQVNEVLKKYPIESGKIQLSYVDIDKNPNFVSAYKQKLSANQVIVESVETKRIKILDYGELFKLGYNSSGAVSSVTSQAEQAISSAILSVSDKNPITIAFTEGFDEVDSTAVQQLIGNNGYVVESLNLVTSDIGEDVDIIAIYGPTVDYTGEALIKLDKWLDNGGNYGKNVLYFSNYEQGETPNLDGFLEDWGISIPRGVVYQTNSNYYSPVSPFLHIQELPETDYLKALANPNLITIAYNVRPVTPLFEEKGNMLTEIIAQSYEGTVSVPVDEVKNPDFDIDSAKDVGIFPSIVTSSKVKYVEFDPHYSRVVAFGGTGLFDPSFLSTASYNNAELLVVMLNEISGKEEGIYIPGKSLSDATLFEMTEGQSKGLTILFIAVLPLIIIVLGVVVWLRRRHR